MLIAIAFDPYEGLDLNDVSVLDAVESPDIVRIRLESEALQLLEHL